MWNVLKFVVLPLALFLSLIAFAEATACTAYYPDTCALSCEKGDECVCEIKSGNNYTRCNQRCQKVNVTQCPTMKCMGEECQQYCQQQSKCTMLCSGGSQCIQECQGSKPGGCDHITCSSSECTQQCADCTMECTSSVKKCHQLCVGGSCHLKCSAETCMPDCSSGNCTHSAAVIVKSRVTTTVLSGGVIFFMFAFFR